MSNAKWCDVGLHPFPEGQPGATTIALRQQIQNQWGGNQPTDRVQDICAACAKDLGMRELSGKANGMSDEELDDAAALIRENTGGRLPGKMRLRDR